MIVTDTSSATFQPCPAGSYLASLRRLIDLGTQSTSYEGKTSSARKVLLTFEIVDTETHTEDGQPFLVHKRYTRSLNEKASLRRDLASWRGRDFTEAELRGFDLEAILGANCMLSIVHATKDNKVFANIAAVMKAPKGLTGSEPSEPLLHFDLDAPNWHTFDVLPQRLQEQIAASPEYKAAKQPKTAATGPAGALPGTSFDDLDNDVPF